VLYQLSYVGRAPTLAGSDSNPDPGRGALSVCVKFSRRALTTAVLGAEMFVPRAGLRKNRRAAGCWAESDPEPLTALRVDVEARVVLVPSPPRLDVLL
jgi:hypothetical protein